MDLNVGSAVLSTLPPWEADMPCCAWKTAVAVADGKWQNSRLADWQLAVDSDYRGRGRCAPEAADMLTRIVLW